MFILYPPTTHGKKVKKMGEEENRGMMIWAVFYMEDLPDTEYTDKGILTGYSIGQLIPKVIFCKTEKEAISRCLKTPLRTFYTEVFNVVNCLGPDNMIQYPIKKRTKLFDELKAKWDLMEESADE